MSLKRVLVFILILGSLLTTVHILMTSIFHDLHNTGVVFHARDLYQFPLLGFSNALPTLVLVGNGKTPVKISSFRISLHFFLTVASVFGGLAYSGWNWRRLDVFVPTVLLFAGIYVSAYLIFDQQQQKSTN